jgi:hypothetical protein
MKSIILSSIFLFVVNISVFASKSDSLPEINKNAHPINQFYIATGSEFIFAYGQQLADSLVFENKLRFSLFPHVQQQYHYNFNKNLGFYTGFSFLNVGFRHFVNTPLNTFELRQRSLSLAVPLALKLGDMDKGTYIAFGASAELMFRYKYKIYLTDVKEKEAEWFSSKVNLFNTSVFVDLRNGKGGYIRFKYYLTDFLRNTPSTFLPPLTSSTVNFSPTQSTLFYVAIGHTFMHKKAKRMKKEDA